MDTQAQQATDKEEGQKVAHKAQEKNEEKEAPAKTDEGVTVSEEFQKRAHELTHKGTKHEMRHLHDRVSEREDELREAENEKKAPAEFSSEEMPS